MVIDDVLKQKWMIRHWLIPEGNCYCPDCKVETFAYNFGCGVFIIFVIAILYWLISLGGE